MVVTAAVFKLLGDVAGRFAETHGASFLFPPAAVYLAAGAAFRGWGVLGVVLGSLLVSWGAAATLQGRVAFALLHGLATLVPAVVLRRPRGSSARRVVRALGAGALANNLLTAILGTGLLVALGGLAGRARPFADNVIAWWTADVVAAIVLGLPLLLLLRTAALLDEAERELFAAWRVDRRRVVRSTGLFLAAVAATVLVEQLGWGFPEWMAIALLAPIALAAYDGGLGAALVANFFVSLFFFGFAVGGGAGPAEASSLRELVTPAYLVLVFYAAFAIVGGLLAGANRMLLDRVKSQQRFLQRDFERIVASLSAAIEAKDPTTDGHVQRVAALAVEVGRRLGVEGRDLELLRYGALLHDVGKIGVPESILNKPGPLTPEEAVIMERHVDIGLKIIGSVEVLQGVAPLIRYHQERWDGIQSGVKYRGYFGLRGEEIPLGARILAVIDALDAITHDRPYRAAQSIEAALAELRREAGRQFDPEVVATLVEVLGESGWPEPHSDSGERLALVR